MHRTADLVVKEDSKGQGTAAGTKKHPLCRQRQAKLEGEKRSCIRRAEVDGNMPQDRKNYSRMLVSRVEKKHEMNVENTLG
jgi:hypothetical protein